MAYSKIVLNGVTQIDLTQDTVAAGKMLNGETAHKNDGTAVTGNITSRSSADLTANNLTVNVPAGHYASAASKTLSDANLVAGNIKKDVSIFGVTGSYEGGGGTPTFIHFGIIGGANSSECIAESGMTWEDFVNSGVNKYNFQYESSGVVSRLLQISGNNIRDDMSGMYLVRYSGTAVNKTDVIIDRGNYNYYYDD